MTTDATGATTPAASAPAAAPAPAPAPAAPVGALTDAPAPAPAPAAEPNAPVGALTDKPADDKPADDKPADDKPADDTPIEYDFKMPEGIEVDETKLTEFKAIAAEAKIPNETAQKLIDLYGDQIKDLVNAPYQAWQDTQREWQQSIAKDPELGGTNFEPMKQEIAKAIDTIGGKDAQKMREAFSFTGAGNNPEIVRFVFRMAKAVNEGATVAGGGPTQVNTKDPAKTLYPSMA